MKKNKHFSRKDKKLPKKVRSAPSVTFFAMRYIGNWRYHPKARKKVLALLRTVYAVSTGRGHIAYLAMYPGHHSAETRIKIMEALAKQYGVNTLASANAMTTVGDSGKVSCWRNMVEGPDAVQSTYSSQPVLKE